MPVVPFDQEAATRPDNPRSAPGAYSLVAIIIAVGLVVAVNVMTLAVLLSATRSPSSPGLGSDNAALVALAGVFGALVGILASQLGFRARAARER
jgi:hypothetical protein